MFYFQKEPRGVQQHTEHLSKCFWYNLNECPEKISNDIVLSCWPPLPDVCQRQVCWWSRMWTGAFWFLMTSWPDWCCPGWNSWAATAGCWMVRATVLFFSYMCRIHMVVLHLSALLCCRNLPIPVLKGDRGVWVTWCLPLLKYDWLAQGLPPSHQSWVAAPDCRPDVANWHFSDEKKSNKNSNFKVLLLVSKSHSSYILGYCWRCYLSIYLLSEMSLFKLNISYRNRLVGMTIKLWH